MPARAERRVLVVDDERDVRDFVSLILTDAGYVVDSAADGREALVKIEKNGALDLVVLDIMMPELDGWQVLERLAPRARRPVIVILSAYADCPRALRAGADGCLDKPFRPHKLLAVCEQVLAA